MYNILGIDQNGKKEVLGFYLAESEGANFWLGVLNDLKERGDTVLLVNKKIIKFPKLHHKIKKYFQLCNSTQIIVSGYVDK